MKENKRLNELNKIIDGIDDDKAAVIRPLLQDVVFLEKRLTELRQLPQIRVHSKDKTRQEATAAAKQYKEATQSYTNILKIVLTALYRTEAGGADELINKLKEFEL